MTVYTTVLAAVNGVVSAVRGKKIDPEEYHDFETIGSNKNGNDPDPITIVPFPGTGRERQTHGRTPTAGTPRGMSGSGPVHADNPRLDIGGATFGNAPTNGAAQDMSLVDATAAGMSLEKTRQARRKAAVNSLHGHVSKQLPL